VQVLVNHPVVDLGADTTSCEGTGKLLNALNAGAVDTWQDGSATSTYIIKDTGYYSTVHDITIQPISIKM
jgi:hypothetical protein